MDHGFQVGDLIRREAWPTGEYGLLLQITPGEFRVHRTDGTRYTYYIDPKMANSNPSKWDSLRWVKKSTTKTGFAGFISRTCNKETEQREIA
jgi:hypothetical protein